MPFCFVNDHKKRITFRPVTQRRPHSFQYHRKKSVFCTMRSRHRRQLEMNLLSESLRKTVPSSTINGTIFYEFNCGSYVIKIWITIKSMQRSVKGISSKVFLHFFFFLLVVCVFKPGILNIAQKL